MDKKYRASARVTMTVDMDHDSWYGTGTSIDQIHAQASRETLQHLENVLREKGIRGIRAKVESVSVKIVEEEQR